jgi:hypothetical protein
MACTLGPYICEQGLRRGLPVKLPPAADDPGSEAAPGCALGAASLNGRDARLERKSIVPVYLVGRCASHRICPRGPLQRPCRRLARHDCVLGIVREKRIWRACALPLCLCKELNCIQFCANVGCRWAAAPDARSPPLGYAGAMGNPCGITLDDGLRWTAGQ